MSTERDLAHEADMRALYKAQLEADCGGDMADPDEWAERNAEGTYDYDEPTPEEKAAYWAEQARLEDEAEAEYHATQDAQVAFYRS